MWIAARGQLEPAGEWDPLRTAAIEALRDGEDTLTFDPEILALEATRPELKALIDAEPRVTSTVAPIGKGMLLATRGSELS